MINKRLLGVILTLLLICTVLIGSASAFAGGSGTQADPYQIATANDFHDIENFLSSYFVLVDDIDLSTYIGTWSAIQGTFTGHLDGAGYTVSNLDYTFTTSITGAIFANSVVVGEIHDITFSDINATTPSGIGQNGLICAKNEGSTFTNVNIENCSLTGNGNDGLFCSQCTSTNNHANWAIFTGCTITNSVIYANGDNVGGFCGTSYEVNMSNCTIDGLKILNGTTTSPTNNIGGYVGVDTNRKSQFTNCDSNNLVINLPDTQNIGGLLGYGAQNRFDVGGGQYNGCDTVNATITGSTYVGGTLGFTSMGDQGNKAYVINCDVSYSTIRATNASGKAGGNVGYLNHCNLSQCDVSNCTIYCGGASSVAGGVVGEYYDGGQSTYYSNADGGSVSSCNIYGATYNDVGMPYTNYSLTGIIHQNYPVYATGLVATASSSGLVTYTIQNKMGAFNEDTMHWVYDYQKNGVLSGLLTADTEEVTYQFEENADYVTRLNLGYEGGTQLSLDSNAFHIGIVTPILTQVTADRLVANYGAPVTYTAVLSPSSPEATSYKFEYSANGGTSWITVYEGANNHCDFGYNPVSPPTSTDVIVRCTASNAQGDSIKKQVTVRYTSDVLPPVVSELTADKTTLGFGEAITLTAVMPTWSSPAGTYTFAYSEDSGVTWTDIYTGSSNTTTYTFVPTMTPYPSSENVMYRVIATGSAGQSDPKTVNTVYKNIPVIEVSCDKTEVWGGRYSHGDRYEEAKAVFTVSTSFSGYIDNYKFEFSKDNGVTWELIQNTNNPICTIYPVLIPSSVYGEFIAYNGKMRVTATSGTSISNPVICNLNVKNMYPTLEISYSSLETYYGDGITLNFRNVNEDCESTGEFFIRRFWTELETIPPSQYSEDIVEYEVITTYFDNFIPEGVIKPHKIKCKYEILTNYYSYFEHKYITTGVYYIYNPDTIIFKGEASPKLSSVTASKNRAYYGESVTFTANVSPESTGNIVSYKFEKYDNDTWDWVVVQNTSSNKWTGTLSAPSRWGENELIVRCTPYTSLYYGYTTDEVSVEFEEGVPVLDSVTADKSTAGYGEQVTFTANLSSGSANSYKFEYSTNGTTWTTGQETSSNTYQVTYNPTPTPTTTTTYYVRCTASSSAGSSATKQTSVQYFNGTPTLDSVTADKTTLSYGENVTFTANLNPSSHPATRYYFRYSINGGTLQYGQDSASNTFTTTYLPSPIPSGNTTYEIHVQAMNSYGTSATKKLVVTFRANPPVISSLSSDKTEAIYGEDITFTANLATGSPTPNSYEFFYSFDSGATFTSFYSGASNTAVFTCNPPLPQPTQTPVIIKVIAYGSAGTSEPKTRNVTFKSLNPVIASFTASPNELMFGEMTRLTVTLSPSATGIIDFTYQQSLDGGLTYTDLATTTNYYYDTTYTQTGLTEKVVKYRVKANTATTYETAIVDVRYHSGGVPQIESFTPTTSIAVYGQYVTLTANMRSGYSATNYKIYGRIDPTGEWQELYSGTQNAYTTTYNPTVKPSSVVVYYKVVATNSFGSDEAETNVTYNGYAPSIQNFSPSSSEARYGEYVKITAVMQAYRTAESYKFEQSVDSGVTWTEISTTTDNYVNVTYSSGESSKVVQYRVTATNSFGTDSKTCQITWGQGVSQTIVDDLDITTEDDYYDLPYRVTEPYRIVGTQTLGDTPYGLIVTTRQIDLVWVKGTTKDEVLIQTLPHLSYDIVGYKCFDTHFVFWDSHNDAYVCSVMTSGLTNPMLLSGFSGTSIQSIDLNNNTVVVGSTNGTQNYGTLFNINNGNLIFEVAGDTNLTCFTVPRITSSGAEINTIMCADNSTKKVRIYHSPTQYVESNTVGVTGNITQIVPFSKSTNFIVSAVTDKAFVGSYTLNNSSASFGSMIDCGDLKLAKIDATGYNMRFVGVSTNNNYVIVNSLNGQVEFTTTLSDQPTAEKISKDNGSYVIAGDYSGRVNIYNYGSTAWNSVQYFTMTSDIVDSSINHDGSIIMSANSYRVYLGYKQHEEQSGETVVTTNYYLKIYVYDDAGNLMINEPVTVISSDGVVTSNTDTNGTVTVKVKATYVYTITANHNTITYIADNNALQYCTIGNGKLPTGDITIDCKLNQTTKKIEFGFISTVNNYNGTLTIYKGQTGKSTDIVQTYSLVDGKTLSAVFDCSTYPTETKFLAVWTYAKSSEVNGQTNQKSWNFDMEKRSPDGVLIVDGAELPILPIDLKNSPLWSYMMTGILLIIAGLFSYRTSSKIGGLVFAGVVILFNWLEFISLPLPLVITVAVFGMIICFAMASKSDGN